MIALAVEAQVPSLDMRETCSLPECRRCMVTMKRRERNVGLGRVLASVPVLSTENQPNCAIESKADFGAVLVTLMWTQQ